MKFKLIKLVNRYFDSTGIYDKYIVYWDAGILHVRNKETLEEEYSFKNTLGGSIYKDFLFIAEQDFTESVFDLLKQKVVKKHEVYFDNTYRISRMHIGKFYACTVQIDEESEPYFFKYDLNLNKVIYKGPANYPAWLALDENYYLSWYYIEEYKPQGILKINALKNSIVWKFTCSELGPYLDVSNLIKLPVWQERRFYKMYYVEGCIFAIISKGIVALDPETGKQLWWIDFNTTERGTVFFDFQPYSLSFADGKIYSRDWHEFLSVSMATGEILLRKEYIGFEVSGKVVENTKNSGLKIHNGKGYFVLDVDAELYLVSMNLETAEVKIETELPDVKDQVHAEDIYFEGNRMYLRDCASFLYVYEVTD